MKKVVLSIALTFSLLVLLAVPAFAAEGGKPAAHGLSGAEFGDLVSDMAPIADHVADSEGAGGKPAAHGLSGAEFGDLVSDMAPIADHVSNK
jgi:hypothetical protein